MTDARLPERWLMDRRLSRVSGEAWGFGYCTSLMWSISNRTDGFLSNEDLRAIPFFKPEYAMELVRAGWWAHDDVGWYILDFEGTQTSRAELESLDLARKQAADYARMKRAKQKAEQVTKAHRELAGELVDDPPRSIGGKRQSDVSTDVSTDVSATKPLTTQARTGKARLGKDRLGKAPLQEEVAPNNRKLVPLSWPTSEPGISNRNVLEELRLEELPPKDMVAAYMEKSGADLNAARKFCAQAMPGQRF